MADHRGGGQERPLQPRLHRERVRWTRPGSCSRSSPRSSPGATPGSPSSIMGTALAVSAISRTGRPSSRGSGCPSATARPATSRSPRSASPRPTPARTSPRSRRAPVYDEAKDEWVLERHQDLDHQRRAGQPPRRSWPRSTPRSAHAATRASSCPRARPGSPRDASSRSSGIRASHTAEVVLDGLPGARVVPPRRQGPARRAPGPGEGGRPLRRPRPPWGPSRRPGPTSAPRRSVSRRAAYEYALDYAKERTQFGKPIIDNQAISFTLADMKTRLDAARLLVWRAAWMGRNRASHFAGRRRVPVEALRGGDRGLGHRAGGADPGRRRLRPRRTRSSAGTGTRRSTRSSRAPRRSSASSSPARSRGCGSTDDLPGRLAAPVPPMRPDADRASSRCAPATRRAR